MDQLTQVSPLLYVIAITILTAYLSFTLGVRIGHSEGYLRGRAIAKALKDKELI